MKQLAWALMVVGAALPGRAEADCGQPRWIGTPSMSKVPVQGVFYVHHERMRFDEEQTPPVEPGIKWIGASSTVSVDKVGPVVYRIEYDAPHAFGAELHADKWDEWEGTHVTFDPGWVAPAAAPRVLQYWHKTDSWTCSYSDSLMIQIDQPAAGFRVRWTYGGATREWIEAPRSTEPTKSVLELGKFNCGSTTVEPEELAAGGHLEVIAIRFDRSEIAVTGLPDTISTKEMPADDGDRTMHLQSVVDALTPVPVVAAVSEPRDPPGIGLGVVVLGIVLLGGALAFRYRVRAPSSLP